MAPATMLAAKPRTKNRRSTSPKSIASGPRVSFLKKFSYASRVLATPKIKLNLIYFNC